ENGVIVPLEGAEGNLKNTISSPIQVHGVNKVAAKRAPDVGEHNEEVLKELGFDAKQIDGLRASGAIPRSRERAAYALAVHGLPKGTGQQSEVARRAEISKKAGKQ